MASREIDAERIGERVATLIDASAAAGPLARARTEELVRLVVELYGAGLERLLDALAEAGRFDDVAQQAVADDDLVAGLLLVHGLHPLDVSTRVQRALDDVRPYLGSHGGDVTLLEITGDGLVRLAFTGTCGSCPSSAATLELAVEGAVAAAAPETTGVELVPTEQPAGGFVPLQSVRVRPRDEPAGRWTAVPGADGLAEGEVRVVDVDGTAVLAMRVGDDRYAYRDGCAACGQPLAGAVLARQLGSRGVLLRCPSCGAHFDVRRAGAGVVSGAGTEIGTDVRLDPLPLLVRDGAVEVALPVLAGAGPA